MLCASVLLIVSVAPRAGAWIEAIRWWSPACLPRSLPVRERGLKRTGWQSAGLLRCVAPRAGAWIEAKRARSTSPLRWVAPRAGAWIEAANQWKMLKVIKVAPRAGAWIEAYAGAM